MSELPASLAVPLTAAARLKGQFGWVAYDMAGGPYFNIVKIFVFAPYFANVIIGDEVRGQAIWGYIEAASGLGIALLSAIVGSAADVYGPRKPLMAALSLIVTLGLAVLWFAAPASPALPIAAVLVLTAIASELAFLCHNSLLTRVASLERIGFISGLGYSFNYLGTLIVFISWLLLFGIAQAPALGLDRAQGEEVRIIGPLAGLWFGLWALPFFLYTPDDARKGPSLGASFGLGLVRLRRTLGHARHYANIIRYLAVRMIYFDGLVATFTFMGIYASGTFGWSAAKVGVYGLVIFSVIVFAAFLGGIIDDRIGSKKTIMTGLGFVMTGVLLALSVSPDSVFFFFAVEPESTARAPLVGGLLAQLGFTHFPEQVFVLCGILGGIFMGPTLASSRTLLARIAPEAMMAEFFGLFTLTGKATSFLAPLVIALVTSATVNQRAGIAAVLVFLLIGLVGMATIKEERSAMAP